MATKMKEEKFLTKNNWKKFVITCCELQIQNTSKQIADTINRNANLNITAGQIAAVKANYSRGSYTK